MNENQEGSGTDNIDQLIKMLDEAKKTIGNLVKALDEAKIIISDLEKGVPYLRPVYKKELRTLELSPRARYVLSTMGVKTVGELAMYSKKRLLRQLHCGSVTANEIEGALKRIGVDLAK